MGYARFLGHKTIMGSMVGSKNYFAPEIVVSAEYKNTVDYWSMGIVAFEITCGVSPFLHDQNLYSRVNSISKKPSECIAITMSNNERLCYHTHLFPEIRLSKAFCSLFEPWLRLALEKDGRKRGYVRQELKFFDTLDEALNAKIFTVYWLNKCKFLSYCIVESTTIDSLLTAMEFDTGVSRKEFYFAFPTGHSLNSILPKVEPMQLYQETFAAEDRPMLYLVDFKTKKLCDPEDAFLSDVMKEFFSTNETLQKRILDKFLLSLLYVHHNERRKILEFLKGIREYAMNLENEMMHQEKYIMGVQERILHYNGKATQFETMVTIGNQLLHKKQVSCSIKLIIRNLHKKLML